MNQRRWLLCISGFAAALLLIAAPSPAKAAMYPHKPVRVILATGAGGSHDMHCRAVASVIHEYLGQPFLCMVRGGGGGKIGMGALKRSKPDGYTIALGSGSHFALAVHARNMGFDTLKDFVPIYQVNYAPFLMVSKPDRPWKDFDGFIAAARKNPGKYSFGSSGAYGSSHLMLLQTMSAMGIKVKHVPFRGGGKAWNAMWGGHVDVAASTPTTGGALARIRAGTLNALAVASPKREKLFPNTPTFREKRVDYIVNSWRVFIAPSGVPKDRIATLVKALRKVSKDKTFKKLLKRFGEQNIPLDGPELQKAYNDSYYFYEKVFKKLGIKKK